MKKAICYILCAACLFFSALFPVSAVASSGDINKDVTIEYLDDGSYFVTEVVQSKLNVRAYGTDGSKTATYYNASGVAMWSVTVYGTFTYTPGVSAKATSASATVRGMDNKVTFVEKDAYTSGASAYGYGKVKYGVDYLDKTVKLTCDTYGNLS